MEAEGLSEKEIRVVVACLMHHPGIKTMWWRWKKNAKTATFAILSAFDGGLLKVTPDELQEILFKLSSSAGVGDEVRKSTTEIFDALQLKRKTPEVFP